MQMGVYLGKVPMYNFSIEELGDRFTLVIVLSHASGFQFPEVMPRICHLHSAAPSVALPELYLPSSA